jgi:hypothetical protein
VGLLVERREALHSDFESVRAEMAREIQDEARQQTRSEQLARLRVANPLAIEPAFAQLFAAAEEPSTEMLASAVNLDIHQRLTPRRDLTAVWPLLQAAAPPGPTQLP